MSNLMTRNLSRIFRHAAILASLCVVFPACVKPRLVFPVDVRTFASICADPASPDAVKLTVSAIKQALNASDCNAADQALASAGEINLSTKQISDLSPLAFGGKLLRIYLDGNRISDLKPLSSLNSDLKPLSSLKGLKALYLNDNRISDLSPLTALTALEALHLDGNSVSDISALTALTHLKALTFASNQVTDTAPLAGLSSLAWLSFDNNSITTVTPLSRLSALVDLSARANPIPMNPSACPVSGVPAGIAAFCGDYLGGI
jgi:internalin A